jgi:glycosyltransferase involved in cell wall biosynthesis
MDLSIIITSYNRPDYLIRCIKSIRAFYHSIDIIVVDNSDSFDHTIVEPFNVKTIDAPTECGASMARNIGIKHATSEYIFIIEDDTIFTKNTDLSKLLNTLMESNVDIVSPLLLEHIGADEYTTYRYQGNFKRNYYNRQVLIEPVNIDANSVCVMDLLPQTIMFKRANNYEWDNNLKVYEHFDFFWRVKQESTVCAINSSVELIHSHGNLFTEYNKNRYNIINNYRKYADSIHGIEFNTRKL